MDRLPWNAGGVARVGIRGATDLSLARVPYPLVCTILGFVLGWSPILLHGPIAEKFNLLHVHGAVAVWAWYTARLMIGFLVGITRWPTRWYVRGPMCGFLVMLPVGIVALATPGCGLR